MRKQKYVCIKKNRNKTEKKKKEEGQEH